MEKKEKLTLIGYHDCVDNHDIIGVLEALKSRIQSGVLSDLCGELEINLYSIKKEITHE